MLREYLLLVQSLTEAGVLKRARTKLIASGSVLKDYMTEKQEKHLLIDLRKCNRTAWLLPNYKASIIYNKLYKSGKHLDIGKTAYTTMRLSLILYGIGSIHLLRRISFISSNGLLEWWPTFLNKTYNMFDKEILPPTKPNMSGNIQVIFIILGIGLLLAVTCMMIECRKITFRYFKLLKELHFVHNLN